MPSFFTPANVAASGWNVISTDVRLITYTNRILCGINAETPDIPTSKFIVKDRISVAFAFLNSPYIELSADADSVDISSLKSGSASYQPLAFNVGGAERMRIATDGLVGFGTTAPTVPLHVKRASDGYIIYAERSSGSIASLYSSTTASWFGTQSNHELRLITNATTAITITTGQLVGIGTTTPGSRLVVNGTLRASALVVGALTVEPTATYIAEFYTGNIKVSNASAECHLLLASTESIKIAATGGSASYIDVTDGALSFQFDGVTKFKLFDTGNVSIGTTSDLGYRLGVVGTVSLSSTLLVSGAVTMTAGGIMNGSWILGNSGTLHANAILQLESVTKGFLPPKMTSTQRDAITSPSGLIIFNTTTSKLNVYGASGWEVISSAAV